jgi:O-antigen/teichoic acid export membrane protein
MLFQRLGRDALIYGFANLLVRGIQIVLIPVYTRVLGSGEYGIVETVAIVAALVNLTVALEISQGMARYIADAPSDLQRRSYASTALGFGAIAYGLFVLLVWVASAPLSNWLLGEDAAARLLLLAAGAVAVNGVFVQVQDLLRWQLRPMAYLNAALAYSLGNAAVGIYLVTVLNAGVGGVFWGQLSGALLGGIVSARGASGLLKAEFDLKRLRRMLSYSMPLVVSGVAVFGNLFVDRIVVRESLGIEALGVYGVAARLASVISILTVGLQAALAPLVFRNWRDPATAAMLARTCRYYCACIAFLVGGIGLFSAEILHLLTGPPFHEARGALPILVLAAMFSSLSIFAPGLFLGERTDLVAAVYVVGAFLNLALSLWLVPPYGIAGAASAATLSAAAVFAGLVLLGRAYFKVPYQATKVAMSLATTSVLALLGLAWGVAADVSTLEVALKLAVLLLGTAVTTIVGLNPADRALLAAKFRIFMHGRRK